MKRLLPLFVALATALPAWGQARPTARPLTLEVAKYVADPLSQWGSLIQQAGIKPE